MFRAGTSVVVIAGSLLSGCAGGNLGAAVAPEAATAAEALGEEATSCRGVADYAEPLVVDWSGQQRLDLELAMKQGVAVVAYTCERFELMPRCRVVGDYRFAGVSQKEEVIQLESKDEVAANLPLSSVSLSASLERGSSIDLGLVMVGKKSTSVSRVARPMLEGDCEGATHFVQAATVGGFAMARGVAGKARAAAEIFSAGMSGASDHTKREESRDGDLKACRTATSTAEAPPDQCQAALRLDLAPVLAELPGGAEAPPTQAPPAPRAVCPEGMKRVGGKCTPAGPEPGCTAGGITACADECEAGTATSCTTLGMLHQMGNGVERDPAEAIRLFRRACDGGDLTACGRAGLLLSRCFSEANPPQGDYGCESASRDDPVRLLLKSCDGGDGFGCAILSLTPKLLEQSKRSPYQLFQRACDLGDASTCGIAGSMLVSGDGGAPEDPAAGEAMLSRACFGGARDACRSLAKLYRGDAPDEPIRGAGLLEVQKAACNLGDTEACLEAGRLYQRGVPGVVIDHAVARDYFERSCLADPVQVDGCQQAAVGRLYNALGERDPDAALGFYVRACEARGKLCDRAARLARDQSREKLHRACREGDGMACDHLSLVLMEKGCREDESGEARICKDLEQRDEAAAKRAYRWRCGLVGASPEHPACQGYLRLGGTLPRKR